MALRLITILIISCLSLANTFGEPAFMVFDFSQNNSTYTWDNSLNKHYQVERLICDLNISTNSLLLKKPSKRWQEQLVATFNADYKVLDGLSIAPYIYHSRNALQDRIVYTSEIKIAMPVSKLKYVDIKPFAANRAIKRVGDDPAGVDRGLGYGIAATGASFKFLQNKIESVISYEYYDLNRIPFSKFNAGLSGEMAFRQADSLSWRLTGNENTTRYYARSAGATDVDSLMIIRQLKVDRRAEGVVKIVLPGDIITRANGDLNFLSYYYNHGSEAVSVSQTDNYTSGRNYQVNVEKLFINRVKAGIGYKYGWGKEDYRAQVLDQLTETGELSFNFAVSLSQNDSIFFDGIVGVSSYFGLRTQSQKERDVQTQIYSARIKHIFTSYFMGDLRFAYSDFHQIYINGLKSANNNENETYLMQASFDWDLTGRTKINQVFAIQANYIMYDYVPNLIDTPNRIFRRGSSETRLTFKITDRFDMMPGYIYRYEDYGKLIYAEDNWQMATGWDRRYHNWSLKLNYRPFRNLRLEPEYIWELKKEYNHILENSSTPEMDDSIIREQRLYDTRQTAGLAIVWELGPNEYLDFSYSRREWDIRGRNRDVSEFVNVSVRYAF